MISYDMDGIGIEDINADAKEMEGMFSNGLSKIEQLARGYIVDISKELPPPPVAMKIKSDGNFITLFTKGNFSIVTGKAKSRKSFLVSQFMATAISGRYADFFVCPTDGMNILFDTEQAEYKVIQVSQRICKLAGVTNPSNFMAYHLRTLEPNQRLDIIEHVLSTTPNLNFVAIDGIIDLGIDPILQADQAQNIISKLMKWTDTYNIHIVCVLHYNKTVSTLLGHLGSFAHRKADCIIEVEKDTENNNLSFVNPVDCREIEFKPFAFSIDNDGMPYINEDYTPSKPAKTTKSEKVTKVKAIVPNEIEKDTHMDILQKVFKLEKGQQYSDLWKNIKLAVAEVCNVNLGDNKAKDWATYYYQSEIIVKIEVNKKQLYSLKEKIQNLFIDASLTV